MRILRSGNQVFKFNNHTRKHQNGTGKNRVSVCLAKARKFQKPSIFF